MELSKTSQFFVGFFAMWILLWLHAKMTTSQYFGFILDTQVALTVSLVVSIILVIIAVVVIILSFFVSNTPFIPIGGLIGLPVAFMTSEIVRLGFAIFFEFI